MSLLVFLVDVLRLAYKSLSERKARAILTIIGVAIGPMALIAMVSTVRGYSNYILGQLEALGQNLIVVLPSQSYRLTTRDLNWLKSLPGVVDAAPFYSMQGVVHVGEEKVRVTIYATDLKLLFRAIRGLNLKEGRVPTSNQPFYALVGYYVAFDRNDRRVYYVGDPLTITLYVAGRRGIEEKRATVIIAGVLERFGSSPILNFDYSVLLPLPAGRRVLQAKEWTGILVLVSKASMVDNITETIRRRYGDLVNVVSFQGIARMVSSISMAMETIAFITSLSAFAVAVAGVSATMITSVVERVREIGVMKALGFTDAQVVFMILLEGVLISLIASVIGVAGGVAGAYIMASRGFTFKGMYETLTIYAQPAITPELVSKTLLVTIFVGAVGSAIPAYKAARIPPAVALRYE